MIKDDIKKLYYDGYEDIELNTFPIIVRLVICPIFFIIVVIIILVKIIINLIKKRIKNE